MQTSTCYVTRGKGEDVAQAHAWLTPGCFTTILALLIVVTFWPVITGSRALFYRDFGAFSYPVAQYHRECFWRGELPLWNSLNHCGTPFLAQWNTLTLYPPALIYLLLPTPWSFCIFCLLHIALGGIGMYYLAGKLTNNRLAASLAGIAFAFNGVSWSELAQGAGVSALGWMPWVILVNDAGLHAGGRCLLRACLVSALQILTGSPEIIVFTWCFVCAFGLIRMGRSTTVNRARLARRIIGSILLTTGLTAAQLLPFFDLLHHSGRNVAYIHTGWAMPTTGLANYVVPLFHLMRDTYGVFSFYDQQLVRSYYVGVGVMAWALLAVFMVPRLETMALYLLASAGLLMAMGDEQGLAGWVSHLVPPVGYVRFPIKFVIVPTFSIPLLAAMAFASSQNIPLSRWRVERIRIMLVGMALLVAIALVAWAAYRFPRIRDDTRLTLLNALSRAAFVVTILAWTWLLRLRVRRWGQRLLQLSFLALIWLDVLTHAPCLNPTVSPVAFLPNVIAKELNVKKDFRIEPLRTLRQSSLGDSVPSTGGRDPTVSFVNFRRTLCADFNMLDHLPSVGGLFSLTVKHSEEVGARLADNPDGCAGLRDFLGIAHFGLSHPIGWRSRENALPLLTIGQQPLFRQEAFILDAVSAEQFDPRDTVILPSTAQAIITAKRCPEATITNAVVRLKHITIDVSTPAPVIIVAAQTYYHAWHAYVDGKSARLWKANYGFQAIEIPRGFHRVELVYEDRVFMLGLIISLVSALGCIVCYRRLESNPSVGKRRVNNQEADA